MAADLNFSMRIGVEDGTEAGLQSATARFKKFMGGLVGKAFTLPFDIGRAGLGILRDVNLGLMPLVRGLDSVISRGSKLEVVRRGFLNLTGQSSKNADVMAKQIVRAASGTMRMAEAMALANRSLGSMSFDDLLTAVEFISKKSVATGKEPGEALNTVITGLVRGSTLFLDDFGILVDGADGVKRSFDAIKGSGAFDQLGPAAQKAETIRQALAEMRQQTGKLGISGKETFFAWSGIRNILGDAVDKLVLAVAKSNGLRTAVTSLANLLGGLSNTFTKSKTPWADVFFGKMQDGGKRGGGLFDLFKAMALDAGELIGRGILGGLLKALGSLGNFLSKLFFAAIDEFLPDLTKKLVEQVNSVTRSALAFANTELDLFLTGLESRLPDFIKDLIPTRPTSVVPSATTQPATAQPATTQPAGPSTLEMIGRTADYVILRAINAFQWWIGAYEFNESQTGHPAWSRDEHGQPWARGKGGGPAGTQQVAMAQVAAAMAMGMSEAPLAPDKDIYSLINSPEVAARIAGRPTKPVNIFDMANKLGDEILAGGVLGGDGRTGAAFDRFSGQFSGPGGKQKVRRVGQPDEFEFTERKRRDLKRDLQKIEELGKAVERGEFGVRKEALRRGALEEAALRKDGKRVTPTDRRRIFNQHLEEVKEEARAKLKIDSEERRRIQREMDADDDVRADRRRMGPAEFGGDAKQRRRALYRSRKYQEQLRKWMRGEGPPPQELGDDGVVGGAKSAKADGKTEVVTTSPASEQLLAKLIEIGSALLGQIGDGAKAIANTGGPKA